MNVIHLLEERNVGFGSNVTVAFSMIKHCIKNNMQCYIDIKNILYGNYDQNIWDLVLEQPFINNIDSIDKNYIIKTNPFELGCWEYPNMQIALEKLRDNQHIKEYQYIYNKFFTLKSDIKKELNTFLKNFEGKKILGIHRRGRDQLGASGHGANQSYKLNLEYIYSVVDQEIDDYDYVFLTSDETEIYDHFIKKYKNKFLFYDKKETFPNNSEGIHYLSANFNIEQKNLHLKNMILETCILSKCNRLLLVNSNVSQIALFLCNHLNYKFYDNHVVYF